MPIAYQEQAQLTCPACGADFAASIWLIIDAQEAPTAAEALRRGELNNVVCPSCGNSGPAGAPLIYHDGPNRRVIFAPAPGAQEHEIRDQARELHALLVGSIPEEQRRPYLADVDIAQDLAGVAHILRRMDSRKGRSSAGGAGSGDNGTGGQAGGFAAPAGSPAPPLPPSPPERGEGPPPLLVAVEAMLAADSPEDLDRALAAHPILLDPSTDATLAQLAEVAREQRAYDIAESLRTARSLLAGLSPSGEPSADVPPTTIPEPALQALLQTGSSTELLAVAELHPLFLRPEADALLAERVNLALDEGNERAAQVIEERREALAELRAARAAAPPAGDEPTLDEAIEALLVAEGEEAMAEVIDRYPLLLEQVVEQALWQFAAEARASGDEDLARYAIECREMLRRVRERLDQ